MPSPQENRQYLLDNTHLSSQVHEFFGVAATQGGCRVMMYQHGVYSVIGVSAAHTPDPPVQVFMLPCGLRSISLGTYSLYMFVPIHQKGILLSGRRLFLLWPHHQKKSPFKKGPKTQHIWSSALHSKTQITRFGVPSGVISWAHTMAHGMGHGMGMPCHGPWHAAVETLGPDHDQS